MLVKIQSNETPLVREVGGKAASLIRLSQAGFPVPSGNVLTTDFFAPWIEQIEKNANWHDVLSALFKVRTSQPNLQERESLSAACDELKQFSTDFDFTKEQRSALEEIRGATADHRFAVRSSSPEEDLAGASFAGLYETVLNVTSNTLETAVRQCFRSCLDARVLIYKREMRIEQFSPSIAVVIQRQVESEISGVVFSLNPVNNDFDELLINASWGLGEALVSGEITPDTLVVDKVSGDVIGSRRGDKGGVRSDQDCLSPAQILELKQTVSRIEALYEEPVDVEWSFFKDILYVLQARPITTYVPLAKELQTEPGAKRMLYFDRSLADGMTMSGPISPLTIDGLEVPLREMIAFIVPGLDPEGVDLAEAGVIVSGSRLYMNLSMYMPLMKSEGMANLMATINTTLADMVVGNDLEPYRMEKPPPFLRKRSLIRHLPRILWKTRTLITSVVKSMLKPAQFLRSYNEAIDNFDEWLSQPIDFTQPLKEQVMASYLKFWEVTEASTYPALIFFMYANATIKQLDRSATPGTGDLVDAICRGYPDDQIVQMGLMMFDLSKALPKQDYEDLETLEQRLQTRALDPVFLSQWDVFIQRFGCRGPLEMEWANPKYGEQPRLALQQIAMIANAGGTFDPHDVQRQLIAEREDAYDRLGQLLPKRKRKRLAKAYKTLLLHSRSRELIKHHIMQLFGRFRIRVLHHADQFVCEGRLDTRDQIFDVTMSEIDRALHEPAFDLRSAAIARGSNFHKLQARVKHFPMAIDSRGRILRPQKKAETGSFKGAPISPGTVTGPIKVLNNPFEKDIEPGDILTAVTTDPGWTPLFINAAAVILEIGGELQHGALVAREYGKPCVAGIPDVTNLLHDGQVVEVDGSAGTIRIVSNQID